MPSQTTWGHVRGTKTYLRIDRSFRRNTYSYSRSRNGFTTYHGAYGLFGVGREPALDIQWWNAPETWRFAWGSRLEGYALFGGTAWGDQYAYAEGRNEDPRAVYLLEATTMRPEVLAPSFEAFLKDELLPNARDPVDDMTIQAVGRFGPIRPENHWVYAPALPLGGSEDIGHVVVLPGEVAMTFAGDIAAALERVGYERHPWGVDPYTDTKGRARLNVIV